jgi:hypothetical protein
MTMYFRISGLAALLACCMASATDGNLVSLPSIMVAPYPGRTIEVSNDLAADIKRLSVSLPSDFREHFQSSISIHGTAPFRGPNTHTISVFGKPIGIVLKWLAEMHGALVDFDGKKVAVRYLPTGTRTESRWYAASAALASAFDSKTADKIKLGSGNQQIVATTVEAILINSVKRFEEIRLITVDETRVLLNADQRTLDAMDRWLVELYEIGVVNAGQNPK